MVKRRCLFWEGAERGRKGQKGTERGRYKKLPFGPL